MNEKEKQIKRLRKKSKLRHWQGYLEAEQVIFLQRTGNQSQFVRDAIALAMIDHGIENNFARERERERGIL